MIRVRIHNLAQARAALEAARRAGQAVTLVSPPALSVGVGWWREILNETGAEGILDCGPSPGLALAAIRVGIRRLWLDADDAMLAKIASIAEQAGGSATKGQEVAIDLLGEPDPGAAVGEALRAGAG